MGVPPPRVKRIVLRTPFFSVFKLKKVKRRPRDPTPIVFSFDLVSFWAAASLKETPKNRLGENFIFVWVCQWSWLEWILQNQVSARRLELNKIYFRQIAPTLHDLVVFKEISVQRLKKRQDANGYSKIWIKAYIEVSCFSRSFCKNLVRGPNNVCLITVPRLPCKAYS